MTDAELAWRVEAVCFNAFPSLKQAILDGWLLRFSKGVSRRANSANPLTREFATPHAVVECPTFMPVGTQGSVKSLTPDEVATRGAQIVLGNTYHLMLRPGAEAINDLGWLHSFTRWPRASS